MCIPPAGRSSPTQSALNITQKTTYHVWNDDFFCLAAVLYNDKGGKKAQEVMLGKIDSVSQPGHWRSISLFTPRDAQSDSRIFQLFISVANRVSFSYDRGLLCQNVFTQSPLAGRQAGGADSLQGQDYFSWPCVLLFLLSLYLSGPVRPVCALCGTVCLSVWLAG